MKLLNWLVLVFQLAICYGKGQLGFNLGMSRNSDNQCKNTDDIIADLAAMGKYGAHTVRIFAVSDCGSLSNLAPALEAANASAFLGIWPTDELHFAQEIGALALHLGQLSREHVKGFIVGSEALYRKDLTGPELADKIRIVRNTVSMLKDKHGNSFNGVPVGLDDTWNMLVEELAKPALLESDVILANAYPFWQAEGPDQMSFSFVNDMSQVMQHLQDVKGNQTYEFWIGETGYPTAGEPWQASVPSVKTAARFWREGICTVLGWGVNTIAFEFQDEKWKYDTSGVHETEKHWGVFDDNRLPKYNLSCH